MKIFCKRFFYVNGSLFIIAMQGKIEIFIGSFVVVNIIAVIGRFIFIGSFVVAGRFIFIRSVVVIGRFLSFVELEMRLTSDVTLLHHIFL